MGFKKTTIASLAIICILATAPLLWGSDDESEHSSAGGCEEILTKKCTTCHPLSRVCQKVGIKNKRSWKRTVKIMTKRGAKAKGDQKVEFTKAEKNTLLDCLVNQREGAKKACK